MVQNTHKTRDIKKKDSLTGSLVPVRESTERNTKKKSLPARGVCGAKSALTEWTSKLLHLYAARTTKEHRTMKNDHFKQPAYSFNQEHYGGWKQVRHTGGGHPWTRRTRAQISPATEIDIAQNIPSRKATIVFALRRGCIIIPHRTQIQIIMSEQLER
ncbi:unnamed protein product [Ectocarpus sp. 12 AP-2014]